MIQISIFILVLLLEIHKIVLACAVELVLHL